MKPTGTTNPMLQGLIAGLRKKSREDEIPLWKKVADDLSRPSRKRRVVNLSKLDRFTKADETVVVPGKVLGSGDINHKVTVSAFQFSDGAKEKIAKAGGTIMALDELMKDNPKGKRIRVIG
jgi:large subunit ribosomal protein L18e